MADAEHSPSPQMSRGIYGFVLFIMMSVFIVLYFVWMLAPNSWYKEWIYEPPQAYWGLAVPVYFCTTLFLFAFCIYPAMHCSHDSELDEPSATTDSFSLPSNYFDELKKTSKLRRAEVSSEKPKLTPTHQRLKSRTWSGIQKELKLEEIKLREEEIILDAGRPILPVSDLDLADVCRLLYLEHQ